MFSKSSAADLMQCERVKVTFSDVFDTDNTENTILAEYLSNEVGIL